MTAKTKVIFRKFPEIIASPNPYQCLSYMHIGQHGAASAEPIGLPATREECKHLLSELREIGYTDLELCTRFNDSHLEKRKKMLRWSEQVNSKNVEEVDKRA